MLLMLTIKLLRDIDVESCWRQRYLVLLAMTLLRRYDHDVI
jgi:hypothetical protein